MAAADHRLLAQRPSNFFMARSLLYLIRGQVQTGLQTAEELDKSLVKSSLRTNDSAISKMAIAIGLNMV